MKKTNFKVEVINRPDEKQSQEKIKELSKLLSKVFKTQNKK